MSVYLRGKTWWFKFHFDGKEIRQSARTAKKREALKAERDYLSKLEIEDRKAAKGATFGDALVKWLQDDAPQSMISHIRNTRPYLESVPLVDVPAAAADMRVEMINRGLSPQTVNRRLAAVRRVLNLAYDRWNMINEPLGRKIEMYSEKGFERDKFLDRDDVKKLVSYMCDETAKSISLLAAFTGLRRSEILGLTADNWRPPYIILSAKTKSKKP